MAIVLDNILNLVMAFLHSPVLGSMLLNAVLGSACFIAAIKHRDINSKWRYVLKYGYAFLAVNFITRFFIHFLYPQHTVGGITLSLIAYATVILLGFGAVFNVCSGHVSNKVSIKYKKRK